MCEICQRMICPSNCPNAPEPEEVEHCEYCDEGIFEDEKMIEVNGKFYHLDCLDDMTTTELLELLGVEIEVA